MKCDPEIIQKAIQNLPKTLDETYDRILLAVPEEERLFVDYALQWIAHYSEMHHGQGIPYKLLIEAAEASILGFTGTRNQRFYDQDTLREVCGCLIYLSTCSRKGFIRVTFAHYSVREYLNSDRSLNAIFGHRPIGGENLKDRLLEITLLEAQHIELNEPRKLKTDFKENLDLFFASMDSDFGVFCVIEALETLNKFRDRFCQNETLKALAIDLFHPSMPHYDFMKAAAYEYEFGAGYSLLEESSGRIWTSQWHPGTDKELIHLYNLLLLTQDGQNGGFLAESFLQGKDLVSLFEAQLCFSSEVDSAFENQEQTNFTFKGSLVEVYAQLAIQGGIYAFKLMIEVGAGFFDPSIVLLLYIGSHDHSDCRNSCAVQRLLDLGADPNLKGYRVTPLQIATSIHDCDGVERLLKAGALQNDTGNPDGVVWEEDSIMHHFNHLHGASPLKICRDFGRVLDDKLRNYSRDEPELIEGLLLSYGAEAFSTTWKLGMLETNGDCLGLDGWNLDIGKVLGEAVPLCSEWSEVDFFK